MGKAGDSSAGDVLRSELIDITALDLEQVLADEGQAIGALRAAPHPTEDPVGVHGRRIRELPRGGRTAGCRLTEWSRTPRIEISVPFRQFILKIASRCNLRCTYCYMYQSHDRSWRDIAHELMSDATVDAVAARIAAYVQRQALLESRWCCTGVSRCSPAATTSRLVTPDAGPHTLGDRHRLGSADQRSAARSARG